jgi:hypothetical protein
VVPSLSFERLRPFCGSDSLLMQGQACLSRATVRTALSEMHACMPYFFTSIVIFMSLRAWLSMPLMPTQVCPDHRPLPHIEGSVPRGDWAPRPCQHGLHIPTPTCTLAAPCQVSNRSKHSKALSIPPAEYLAVIRVHQTGCYVPEPSVTMVHDSPTLSYITAGLAQS